MLGLGFLELGLGLTVGSRVRARSTSRVIVRVNV